MAWLRKRLKGGVYYYSIVKSQRRGEQVVTKVLEWLGKNPTRKKLVEARRYWKVKRKGRKGR